VSGDDSQEVLERFHSSLDLVDAIARQVLRRTARYLQLDELQSLGQEGLWSAARRFDPEQGVPFRPYASYRIRGAMLDGARRASQLPRSVYEKLRCYELANQYCEGVALDQMGPAPPGETRADAQRLLDEHLANMATAIAVGLLAETAVGDDGALTNVDPRESADRSLEQAQILDLIREQVSHLPDEERELVRRHYFEGERFDLVAQDLGLSKSWASRLHTRAIGRLSKRLRQEV